MFSLRKFFVAFFLLALIVDTFQYTFGQSGDTQLPLPSSKETSERTYVPGELIVKFKTEKINLKQTSSLAKLQLFENNNDLDMSTFLTRENSAVLKIQSNETVESKIEQLETDPNVEYAQPNFIYQIQITNPNDTDFAKLRGLKNTGQNILGVVGTSGADIGRNEAMDIFSGNGNPAITGTIVAVIDNGVHYTHTDLIQNMWSGINCLSYTGMTLGGCLYGYDFYSTGDTDPFPNGTDFHGTHVAGTIGASMNNSTGIVGVNPNVKIMAIRSGSGNELTTEDIAEGIDFAKYNGARIINASRGGGSGVCAGAWDQLLYDAIKNFPGLVIASAGNDTQEHLNGYFSIPSDFSATTSCRTGLDNIIGVAATDQNDVLATFSDYGSGTIHVGAPGENIYSTVLSNGYNYSDGTSMAAPHVAGLASLAWSYRPDLGYLEIKNAIMNGGDTLSSLTGKTVSGKRINAYTTLYTLTSTVTGSITFLSGSRTNTTGTYVRLIASKTGTYQMSGIGMIGVLTGNIPLSGLDLLVQLTSGDGVKNVGVIFSDTIPKQSQLYTASIILDTTAPSIPVLISPISGTSVSGVFLLWNASIDTGGMSGYLYEVSSDSGMNILVATGSVTTTGVNVSLFSGASYYRRIRAFDMVGYTSNFSQTGDFVLLRDSWPDAFSFTAVTSAELSTQYTSNQITIVGMNTGSIISIVGGTYQTNSTGGFISTTGIVYSGDMIQVRITSSSAYSTQTLATVNVGDIQGNFSVTTKSAPSGGGGGGGGGGGTLTPSCLATNLLCSGSVYVMKTGVNCIGGNLGNTCTSIASGSTGIVPVPIYLDTTSSQGNIMNSPFSVEMNTAYLYAYDIGITTMNTIQKADMTGSVIRAHMAKMMVNYAIKVLEKQVNTGMFCLFTDIADQSPEMKLYIKLACQLGLMGVGISEFNPNGEVTRAQFGTVLSRVLYGDIYNDGVPFYLNHLNALQANKIISNTTPELKELRGYVMLMLMRAAE